MCLSANKNLLRTFISCFFYRNYLWNKLKIYDYLGFRFIFCNGLPFVFNFKRFSSKKNISPHFSPYSFNFFIIKLRILVHWQTKKHLRMGCRRFFWISCSFIGYLQNFTLKIYTRTSAFRTINKIRKQGIHSWYVTRRNYDYLTKNR